MSQRTEHRIDSPVNPYRDNVQGKANEPITVAGLLDRARREVGGPAPDWTLERIYDRLEQNAPRVAIIGGSADHPAHIADWGTVARAALRIWADGGLPFSFATPVLCDGTAQSNMGMSYSLQSRNAIAEVVVNQMEAHAYHAAFVIQGCDKQPLGVVSGLAHLDQVRRRRGEAPVWATFAPAHVLQGGTIPPEVRAQIDQICGEAEVAGHPEIANDLRDAASYILQCSSNTAFQGVFERAVQAGILTRTRHKELERALAVNTCDPLGGICAFNGTGNSSRHLVAGLGLVHPDLELLVEPPTDLQVGRAVDALFGLFNRPAFSVGELVLQNVANAVRIHSASGGSTNLYMHLVAAMIYAGVPWSVHELERIHQAHPVPDLFDYSLTRGRDIHALAHQCCAGRIQGMRTLVYELVCNGVPMDLDAPTVSGVTWQELLDDPLALRAENVPDHARIILDTPKRPYSGVDVLAGNFLESAVVKISGMPEYQLKEFDEQAAFVLFFENEEAANRALLNVHLLDELRDRQAWPEAPLRAMARLNGALLGGGAAALAEQAFDLPYGRLCDEMAACGSLKLALVIAGQGPEAFGMPEMFTPMQHINANRVLRKIAVLISDGRYSGVSYGAAIGHVTPEAARGGAIGRLQTGDLLLLGFRRRRLDLLDGIAFAEGRLELSAQALAHRDDLAAERLRRIRRRQLQVAASNRLAGSTDAAHGVVPLAVWDDARFTAEEGGSLV